MYVEEEDYTGGIMMVNIPAGVMTQQFTVFITDNNVVECVETFNVTISSITTCGVTKGSVSNAEVQIIDDESKACVVNNMFENNVVIMNIPKSIA